jgi:hypothetical protein
MRIHPGDTISSTDYLEELWTAKQRDWITRLLSDNASD